MKSLIAIVLFLTCLPCLSHAQSCGETSQSSIDSGDAYWGLATPCVTGSNSAGYTVSSISYWVGSPVSNSFALGVYSTSSGNPNSLLCSVSTGTITPSSGWNSINISGCPTLSPSTTYWIGYITGSGTIEQGLVTGNCPGTSSVSEWTSATQPGVSLPSTFGTPNAGSGCYSLYMSLSAVGGGGGGTITGSGAANTVPVFTASSVLGNSPISVSAGNIGIGTTNPQSALDIESGALQVGSYFRAASEGDGSVIYDPSGIYLRFVVGSVEPLWLSGTGNVGIGTQTPVSALQVVGGVTSGASYNAMPIPSIGAVPTYSALFGDTSQSSGLDRRNPSIQRNVASVRTI